MMADRGSGRGRRPGPNLSNRPTGRTPSPQLPVLGSLGVLRSQVVRPFGSGFLPPTARTLWGDVLPGAPHPCAGDERRGPRRRRPPPDGGLRSYLGLASLRSWSFAFFFAS